MAEIFKICIAVFMLCKEVQSTPVAHDAALLLGTQVSHNGSDSTEPSTPSINKNETEDKSRGIFGFLNGLNTLGGLINSRPSAILGGPNKDTSSNNGIEATTPRLNGRPGLGFIPDVTKGINTILSGVASGNLEQVLEGSFIFAPNGVQLVAGNVLDRVFLTTPSTPTSSPSQAKTTAATRTLGSAEAQAELLKIIQQQQLQINALQNAQKDKHIMTS